MFLFLLLLVSLFSPGSPSRMSGKEIEREKEKEEKEKERKALRELYDALHDRDADRVTGVLQRGAITPQAVDKGAHGGINYSTPLTWAIYLDFSLSVLDQLIAAGAKVETRDPFDKVTPLAWAVWIKRPALVDHLLHRHGADPNATMTNKGYGL